MALDDKDKEWVKSWVREYADPRFVHQKDCETKTNAIDDKLSRDYADKQVIKSQLKLIIGILGAIGLGILGLVLNQFWGF